MGNRIVILGNAAGGKSHLARRLSDARSLPLHALDRLAWNPGWVRTPTVDFDAAHDRLLEGDAWIIDGVVTLESVERRLAACDTIVLIDLPLRQHVAWAMKRQLRCLIREREDFAPGCPMLPMTVPLLRMMWWYHRSMRPRIRALISRVLPERHWYPIRSRAALDLFTSQYTDTPCTG